MGYTHPRNINPRTKKKKNCVFDMSSIIIQEILITNEHNKHTLSSVKN